MHVSGNELAGFRNPLQGDCQCLGIYSFTKPSTTANYRRSPYLYEIKYNEPWTEGDNVINANGNSPHVYKYLCVQVDPFKMLYNNILYYTR